MLRIGVFAAQNDRSVGHIERLCVDDIFLDGVLTVGLLARHLLHGDLARGAGERRLLLSSAGDVAELEDGLVVLHLGNGASMCALAAGQSCASTMGFTAVDGLPMGTRCGNLDPGVILWAQRHGGLSADAPEYDGIAELRFDSAADLDAHIRLSRDERKPIRGDIQRFVAQATTYRVAEYVQR